MTCPVRLLHVLQDEEVPHSRALRLVERCRSPDASILLMHKARHAMLGDREVDATVAAVESCWIAYLATVPDRKFRKFELNPLLTSFTSQSLTCSSRE